MNRIGIRTIAVEAPAKLNLVFDILGLRADGYHEISTIFQAISLSDRLKFDVQSQPSFDIRLKTASAEPLEQFPLDDTNLIVKAARLFFDETKIETNFALNVEVTKIIPIGAGLAGGSSNCAATLLGLNKLFCEPLDQQGLLKLAAALGSDVPFCLSGGAALGGGRGEQLSPLAVPLMHFVIVKPKNFSISTPWAYQTFDKEGKKSSLGTKSRSEKACEHLPTTARAFSQCFGNDFEEVVFANHPFLAKVKQQLIELGSSVSFLTGSGPTIYGLADSEAEARRIARDFIGTNISNGKEKIEFEIWPVHTIEHGVKVISDGN